MNNLFEYIELYFAGKLTTEERSAFEARCENDPEFAREVAFYVNTRDRLKEELYDQKKAEFNGLYEQLSAKNKVKKNKIKPLIAYISIAAAACFLLFFYWNTGFNDASPESIANNYISENLQNLSVSMGSTEDSLQHGINAYNQGLYEEAAKYFSSLQGNQTLQAEATKYLGITYLQTGEYDKAITQFDILSGIASLYDNPGLFYKALTLMKRSGENDLDEAEKLLQEVIQKDLSGRRYAQEWAEKLEN